VEVHVVSAAEQSQVADRGHTSVDPAVKMVGVTLDRWSSADDAAFVAGVQGAAHRAGDQSFGAADV
jgi:hypothetical protein